MNTNNRVTVTGPVMRSQPWPPDIRLLGSLPYCDSLELDAADTAPRAARRWIARLLPEWSLPEFETAASLIASELITNAVAATCAMPWTSVAPPVRLWLRGGPGVLAILVWDATIVAPVPGKATAEDESGRGLAIVATLSADCGFCYPDRRYDGKVTWAMITTP